MINLRSIVPWLKFLLSCELCLTRVSSCHHQFAHFTAEMQAWAVLSAPKSPYLIGPSWQWSLIGGVIELMRVHVPLKSAARSSSGAVHVSKSAGSCRANHQDIECSAREVPIKAHRPLTGTFELILLM